MTEGLLRWVIGGVGAWTVVRPSWLDMQSSISWCFEIELERDIRETRFR